MISSCSIRRKRHENSIIQSALTYFQRLRRKIVMVYLFAGQLMLKGPKEIGIAYSGKAAESLEKRRSMPKMRNNF